jgi:hypothetical protein
MNFLKEAREMGKQYFTKSGWGGLSLKGKFQAVLIWAATSVLAFFIAPLFMDMSYKSIFSAIESGNYFSIAVSCGIGFGIAWVLHHFLPKDTYYHTEYFCSMCNQYLGYSPETCPRCGSNRYTTSG